MKKLYYKDKELSIGFEIPRDSDAEHGIIVGIDYDAQEVHVYDCKEGWTMSEANGNMGGCEFR